MSYQDYDPDLFDEHADDGRGLDNEIDDSPRMRDFYEGDEQGDLSEIVGADLLVGAEQEAILQTLAKARDNRRPCPPMRAVDLDAPLPEDDEDLLGAAAGPEAFPLLAQLMETWRQAGRPRIVRVDTEQSYQAFRDSGSPERMALLERLADLEGRLDAHLSDPDAHNPDLGEEIEEAEGLAAADEDKLIPLRMPRHFDGLLEAWHQGDMVAASMLLPRPDGERWVATASESRKKGELEAAKAAAEAGVPAAAIVGYLPAIGATLSAADAVKALAAGADDKPGTLLKRPEARGNQPFMVRLEPQASPALFALGELLCLCQQGNAQACAEWNRLAQGAPLPVRQVMGEIQAALKSAAPKTAVGGTAREPPLGAYRSGVRAGLGLPNRDVFGDDKQSYDAFDSGRELARAAGIEGRRDELTVGPLEDGYKDVDPAISAAFAEGWRLCQAGGRLPTTADDPGVARSRRKWTNWARSDGFWGALHARGQEPGLLGKAWNWLRGLLGLGEEQKAQAPTAMLPASPKALPQRASA